MIIRKLKYILILFAFVSFVHPFSATCQITGSVAGRDIIFPTREMTVQAALDQISRQGGYNLAVNWEHLAPGRRLQLSASQLPVADALNQIMSGTGLRWEIMGRTIAIVRARVEAPPTPQPQPPISPDYPLYSTMYRTALPPNMTAIPDPRSSRQISAADIARVENGYWASSDGAGESLSLVILNFKVGSTAIERNYMENDYAMQIIDHTFSNAQLLSNIDFITVTAAASPEGNTATNERLASHRAMAVKNHIMQRYPFLNRERIFTFSIGEDWTGLRKMVEDDPNVPYRAQVLNVLDSNFGSDARRSMLRTMAGGAAYRYISQYMLPRLRGAAACMIYFKKEPAPVPVVVAQQPQQPQPQPPQAPVYIRQVEQPVVQQVPQPVPEPVEVIIEEPKVVEVPEPVTTELRQPYYWALKSNLLHDVILVPDLAMEFSLGRKYSVEFGGQWSWWWGDETQKSSWRIQAAGVEARRWLGNRIVKTPLSGHFVGIYGMAGTYDVRLNAKTGYLSDMSYSVGLSYGYSTRIGRSLNMEFGLSVGYLGGTYQTYTTFDHIEGQFYEDNSYRRHYFGPTKARVSLVWLPGGKNTRKNK